MLKCALFLSLSIAACTSFKEEDSGGSGNGGGNGGGGGPGNVDPTCERPHYGLTDLSSSLSEWDCDIQQATGVAGLGATSYFYGVYKEAEGGFTGFEEWILFANDTWRDDGGSDCTIRWNVSAVSDDPETCPACDVALDVIFTLDKSCSTCPDDMIDAQESNATERYEVQRSADGTSRWFYASSGNQFGTGKTNSNAMNFVTNDSCVWF